MTSFDFREFVGRQVKVLELGKERTADDNPAFVISFKFLNSEVAGQVVHTINFSFKAVDGLIMMRNFDYDFVFLDIDGSIFTFVTAQSASAGSKN